MRLNVRKQAIQLAKYTIKGCEVWCLFRDKHASEQSCRYCQDGITKDVITILVEALEGDKCTCGYYANAPSNGQIHASDCLVKQTVAELRAENTQLKQDKIDMQGAIVYLKKQMKSAS